jgi:hypothetical protein
MRTSIVSAPGRLIPILAILLILLFSSQSAPPQDVPRANITAPSEVTPIDIFTVKAAVPGPVKAKAARYEWSCDGGVILEKQGTLEPSVQLTGFIHRSNIKGQKAVVRLLVKDGAGNRISYGFVEVLLKPLPEIRFAPTPGWAKDGAGQSAAFKTRHASGEFSASFATRDFPSLSALEADMKRYYPQGLAPITVGAFKGYVGRGSIDEQNAEDDGEDMRSGIVYIGGYSGEAVLMKGKAALVVSFKAGGRAAAGADSQSAAARAKSEMHKAIRDIDKMLSGLAISEEAPQKEDICDLHIEPDFVQLTRGDNNNYLLHEDRADRQSVVVFVKNASAKTAAKGVQVQLWLLPRGKSERVALGGPLKAGDIAPGGSGWVQYVWDLEGKNVEGVGLSAQVFIPGSDDAKPEDNFAGVECSIFYAHNGERAFSWKSDTYSYENYGFEDRELEELMEGFLATAAGAMEGSKEKQSIWRRLLFPQTYTRFIDYVDTSYKSAAGGHCYGMAATSALYFEDPSLKPVPKPVPQMSKEEASTNVNIYHKAQMQSVFDAVITGRKFQTRDFGVAKCHQAIRSCLKDERKALIIEFFGEMNNKSAGHAVLAYKLVEVNGKDPVVYVYDSNFPVSQAQPPRPMSLITLKTSQNNWSNPQYMGYDWAFNDLISAKRVNRTIPLEAVNALVPALKKQVYDSIGLLHKANKIMAVLRCPADIVFMDGDGKRTGTQGGKTVNEIPGAEVITSGGVEIYRLPADREYSVILEGTKKGNAGFDLIRAEAADQAGLTIFEGIPVSPDAPLKGTLSNGRLTKLESRYGVSSPATDTTLKL